MKECEEFAPLLSAFVDGELTEEERAEVLAHVSECEKCRRLLGELTALHAALGELEDEDVPAGFTEGVMAAVRAEKAAKKPQAKKRSTWRRWMPMAACAAIVALAAAVTIPRTAMKQEANDAAPAAPAAQEDQAMFSMAAPPSDPLPDTDAEVEYPEQRCETVQSSPYYDRQLGGAAARTGSRPQTHPLTWKTAAQRQNTTARPLPSARAEERVNFWQPTTACRCLSCTARARRTMCSQAAA